ncbi:hypothetical protein CHARACLAT_008734, partial [Characodon lateralis]|nr:hypothetical protein [Characodon lateralis]
FIQEIEMNMGPSQAKQCQLRAFLTYYINDLFLNQVRTEINKEIQAVSKAADPLKVLASADTMKLLSVQRPLLQQLLEVNVGLFVSVRAFLSVFSQGANSGGSSLQREKGLWVFGVQRGLFTAQAPP